jgi:hypothetical protein
VTLVLWVEQIPNALTVNLHVRDLGSKAQGWVLVRFYPPKEFMARERDDAAFFAIAHLGKKKKEERGRTREREREWG